MGFGFGDEIKNGDMCIFCQSWLLYLFIYLFIFCYSMSVGPLK